MSAVPRPHADRPVRVLVADDQALFRGAIAALVDAQPDLEVVAQASHGLEAVELCLDSAPDVAILDVEMPVVGGIEAARRIREACPDVRIIMLTVCDDDAHLLEAIELGVHGYLLKDLQPEQLFDMIRSAMNGENPVSPALVGRLLAALRSTGRLARPTSPASPPEPVLSQRELEIMQLVARGCSNREIGRTLSITEGTVKNHVHNALHKLGMDNRIQAAAYIIRQGLATPAGR